jgi:hypothetical protein
MSFISSPNLPQSQVKCVLLGARYKKISEKLKEKNINTIQVPDNMDVLPWLCGHADLSLCHLGGKLMLLSKSLEGFAKELSALGFDVLTTDKPSASVYPADVGLNACLINGRLFHRLKYTDKRLISEALRNGCEPVNVSQAYTKCNICVVDENHIITEDKSIHKAADSCGIVSLLLSPGFIKLDGFNYGFIGGASGKLSKNILAFTGLLSGHPDEKRIYEFLDNCNVEPLYLSDEQCFDVGSIIPVIEDDI